MEETNTVFELCWWFWIL